MTAQEEIAKLKDIIAVLLEENLVLNSIHVPGDPNRHTTTTQYELSPMEWLELHAGRVRIMYKGRSHANIVIEHPRNFKIKHISRKTV